MLSANLASEYRRRPLKASLPFEVTTLSLSCFWLCHLDRLAENRRVRQNEDNNILEQITQLINARNQRDDDLDNEAAKIAETTNASISQVAERCLEPTQFSKQLESQIGEQTTQVGI